MNTFWLRTSYIELFGTTPVQSDEELRVLFEESGQDTCFALELAREADPAAPAPRIES